jgi:hypothetical protein
MVTKAAGGDRLDAPVAARASPHGRPGTWPSTPEPRPTRKSRALRGKTARAEAPRSSQREWQPSADRADPVQILMDQASARLPDLVPERHGRMPAGSRSSDPRNSADPSEPSTDSTDRTSPGVLLVYFSRAGENYYYGDRIDLEVGNSEVLSRTIGRQFRSVSVEHLYRIEAADPYPEETVARNVREQEADARSSIANPLESIDDYDVILIGSPIWNVRPSMFMLTFADGHDFTGKTVRAAGHETQTDHVWSVDGGRLKSFLFYDADRNLVQFCEEFDVKAAT